MALGNVIAKLSVALGMETASFDRGAKKAEGTIGRLKSFLLGPAGLAAASGAVGAALGKLTAAAINTADEISKAAQSVGIGTEELSRLRYAADLSGVSFEQLTKGVGRLARNMNDASNGLKAPARAFDQLGIAVTDSDGKLRTSSEVIGDIAERFSQMEDGAKKTALAQELLGRAGADMIPFLNMGRDGIAELTAEADKFGIVIDEETGRRAEAFNDNMTRLSGTASALGTRIAAELLPYLEEFTNWLVDNAGTLVRHAGKVAEWGAFLVNSVRYTLNEFKYLWDYAGYLDSRLPWWLGGTGKNLSAPINQNRINELQGAVDQAVGLANAVMGVGRANARTAPTFEPVAVAATGAAKRGGKAIKSGLTDAMRDAKKEADDFARLMDRLFPEEKVTREFRSELAEIDKQFEKGKLSAEQYQEATRRLWKGFYEDTRPAKGPELLSDVEPLVPDMRKIEEGIERLTKKAKDNTVKIAKSFKDMADDTLGALNRLSNSIREGGFLGILEGLIGLGLQLGSVGLFGKSIQNNLNRIPGNANGTSFWGGGLSWVGERGPELVNLPRGSQVHSNKDSRAMMGGKLDILPSPLFDVYLDGKLIQAAPALVDAGGRAGVARMSHLQSRRIR